MSVGIGVVVVAGLVVAISLLPVGLGAVSLALVSILFLGYGIRHWDSPAGRVGSVLLFTSLLGAGLEGLPPENLLVATIGAVAAWDVAGYVGDLRRQLDPDAVRTRHVLVHSGATLSVSAFVAAVAYSGYLFGATGSPIAGVLVVAGAVLVVFGLRPLSE